MTKSLAALLLAATGASLALAAPAQRPARPWMAPGLSPDRRAALALEAMTREEKLRLVFGYFSTDFPPKKYRMPEGGREGSAGYVPGILRLGIPPQWQTDAGIGVASQGGAKVKRERTALPSGLATTATWNPDLAFQGGRMIGAEARASGFNVMLAGGVNLLRDPRNGRNFEYGGEDPLLAGTMVGAQIAGIQSNRIVSTVKHYAMNDLETGRDYHDARIAPEAARMSDLLAFQFAIERSDPGSVMCAYNRVNGTHACENKWLLTDLLRGDFGWKGYVMSDWGATHSTEAAANAGLDQDSGFPFDKEPYFGEPLRSAVAAGRVPPARLDEMAGRILRSMFAHGLVDSPVAPGPIDMAAHASVTRADAEQAAVLLRNEGNLLPLSPAARRIVVIGSHADRGVLSGGGSSQTYPVGGNAVPGLEPTGWPGPVIYYPNSPLLAMKSLAPNAELVFVDGGDPAAAARAAAGADAAVVFLNQWTSESIDAPLVLPDGQDALVEAVAAANPRTVAVLETGGPVLMPWAGRVGAILEAWYPGTAGGEAIANLLFGKANPSGRLPVTFPRDESQLPRPVRPGTGLADGEMFAIDYAEGAAVGYKYYDAKGLEPLFPFGHGLSYTRFAYSGLRASAARGTVTVSFRVTNTGRRRGMDVPQVYVAGSGWEAPKRLAGFRKLDLAPGASANVALTLDPRLLATFSGNQWRIAGGSYKLLLGASSRDIKDTVTVRLPARVLPASWRP
ncbi:MAG: glycoside hydrolase family 3 C-terminal domain-containing protein [Alphaproteobacteria bacterium]|nr:glycoside hydrolase family 3 C-terminal domain-containing protein [Alphaproteobacteria bacterium]MBV9370095.1 glycoside hydrolase family 3 C-terminal domain-containing protein [Alphaproteobacteria bacterium]MBV9901009.1 glycoside hydrolase family 3 C-terminal domain-containing protein [Alphaproteobacteria bacterium]